MRGRHSPRLIFIVFLRANKFFVFSIQCVLDLIAGKICERQEFLHRFVELLVDLGTLFRRGTVQPILEKQKPVENLARLHRSRIAIT